MDQPTVGMEVCMVNRKGREIYGEIVRVWSDPRVTWFVVEWGPGDRTEYPLRVWGDRVYRRPATT